jgi:hypothetical protein
MDLQLIATLIGQLSIISGDPALGYRGQAITQALALLATIFAKGDEARQELKDLADQVAQMVAEKREPTKAEWVSLRDLSKKHHEVLNPPAPPEEEASDDLGEHDVESDVK